MPLSTPHVNYDVHLKTVCPRSPDSANCLDFPQKELETCSPDVHFCHSSGIVAWLGVLQTGFTALGLMLLNISFYSDFAVATYVSNNQG